MSTTTSQTQYTINGDFGTGSNFVINLYANEGFTDAIVAEIYSAMASATWPEPVTTNNLSLMKQDLGNTLYTTDYSSSPISFT